jgi:hypothetical protein
LNVPRLCAVAVLLVGAMVLLGAAWLRGDEYDEQYTAFLLAGDARPAWPSGVFAAGEVRGRFHGEASLARIAGDLRHFDVHPPLYFWAVSLWSRAVGDALFSLRLFSALCGLGALATVGLIARRAGVPAALAMLLTLGCYAFAYTASVARGFAMAQFLVLLGVLFALSRDTEAGANGAVCQPALTLIFRRHPRRRQRIHALQRYGGEKVVNGRPSPTMTVMRSAGGTPGGLVFRCVAAGLLLGAASFANYLAAFTAVPVLLCLAARRLRDGALAAVGFAGFVAADLTFFLAQRNSRPDQFPPFHLGEGLVRLAKYGTASVAGGLPLYIPEDLAGPMGVASAGVLLGMTLLVALRWRHIGTPASRALLGGAVVATPVGLLLLGLAFDNTPIELRYLSFAAPYGALLLAGALASLTRPAATACAAAVLALQAAAIFGLLLRPETMQPMRDAAREAASLADTRTVVLLPRGNDGVGVVGAFIAEAPDDLRLFLVDRDTTVPSLHGVAPRLALALLGRDRESRAALASLRAGFAADPCWRAVRGGSAVAVYVTSCPPDRRQASAVSTAR